MMPRIATIIPYCTYDYQFIGRQIAEASRFSDQIIIVYGDYFFDGTPENKELVERTIRDNHKARFIFLRYEKIVPPVFGHWFWKFFPKSSGLRPLYGRQFMACKARLVGYQSLLSGADYVLFLDSDEVVDGNKFKSWLEVGEYKNFSALTFRCYLYFRETRYQAEETGQYGLLIKRTAIPEKRFFSYEERSILHKRAAGKKKFWVVGLDGLPMIHHYSWVRSKEDMLIKVRTWGHSLDRDWIKLVNDEFSHEFNGTDFVWGYNYKTVKPFLKSS